MHIGGTARQWYGSFASGFDMTAMDMDRIPTLPGAKFIRKNATANIPCWCQNWNSKQYCAAYVFHRIGSWFTLTYTQTLTPSSQQHTPLIAVWLDTTKQKHTDRTNEYFCSSRFISNVWICMFDCYIANIRFQQVRNGSAKYANWRRSYTHSYTAACSDSTFRTIPRYLCRASCTHT